MKSCQHQTIILFDKKEAVSEMFSQFKIFNSCSFFAVMKPFGNETTPELLFFPIEGMTTVLDFPNKGSSDLELLDELDK